MYFVEHADMSHWLAYHYYLNNYNNSFAFLAVLYIRWYQNDSSLVVDVTDNLRLEVASVAGGDAVFMSSVAVEDATVNNIRSYEVSKVKLKYTAFAKNVSQRAVVGGFKFKVKQWKVILVACQTMFK